MGDGWLNEDENTMGYHQVGYSKVDGKWCIALTEVTEYPDGREDDCVIWAFSDGPRRLRLRAIDYLPKLLDELANKAMSETLHIASRMDDLQELVNGLKEGGKQ
jgi:hypothetical protein